MANLIVRAINGLFDRDSGKLVSVIPDGVNDLTSVATVDFNKLTGGLEFPGLADGAPSAVPNVIAFAHDGSAYVGWSASPLATSYIVTASTGEVVTYKCLKSNYWCRQG